MPYPIPEHLDGRERVLIAAREAHDDGAEIARGLRRDHWERRVCFAGLALLVAVASVVLWVKLTAVETKVDAEAERAAHRRSGG